MVVEPAQLGEILDLYQKSRMLDAYEAAQKIGPLKTWRGTGARVLAGRLALNLGAAHLGRVLHRLAYRENPTDPQAAYYEARVVFERRGPLPAWDFLQQRGDMPDAPAEIRADWLSFHAQVLGSLRDFDTAERWLDDAENVAPKNPWLWIERSQLLERQDRYDLALEAARRSLEIHPWYRPGVQAVASLLQLLDRDGEALDLLRASDEYLQNGPIVMQRALLETELRLYPDARESWERALALSPLMDKALEKWLNGVRSDAAYYCGDHERAAELAELTKNPFHEEAAKKIRQNAGQGRRIVLDVPFVRQHHMTCAPATLSAISRYWSIPAAHLEVAEAICYDGTPAHSERAWAEKSGYIAREFSVDWNSTVALIDRGVPFTFTTVETTSAHLQAVIGYDSVRGTILIRDPFMRQFGEFIAEPVFKRYRHSGPRGMVLVPAGRAELLVGIELPDAGLYDIMHRVQQALVAHDRQAAQTLFDEMEQADAGHRLTLWARRSLASYDADLPTALATIERLLTLYPDNANLKLSKLSYLRVLSRREERVALLTAFCEEKGSDSIFWQQLASELADDARQGPQAMRLIRRALRSRRYDAMVLRSFADALWNVGRQSQAEQIYRFAACLNDKDEGLARSYFIASRHMKRVDSALRMLEGRFRRFGKQSSQPAKSLFWAMETLNQDVEGFKILEQALALRPADGALKLFVASSHARHGRLSTADELLAAARGISSPNEWLRASADIATYKGDLNEAAALWTQIADAEPLATDAHSMLARLLAETQSPAAALAHLEKTANRFPQNYSLTQLLIYRMREEAGAAELEAAVRRLIEIHPADGWARRELALVLCKSGRFDEALAEAEASMTMEPANPSSLHLKGHVLSRMGRLTEAADAFRGAIALSVDADFAIEGLIQICDTRAQKMETLSFVHEEIVRQTIFGDALLAYRAHARALLDADQTLASLRAALSARPDLWQAWSAVSAQLVNMGRSDEAATVSTEATERFPLLPRPWFDLANAYGAAADREAQIAALEKALELSPGWGVAIRALAEVYDDRGEFARSRELLERAIRHSPLEATTHGALADALWKLGERDAALARIEHAVKLDPGYQWAWDTLVRWGTELKKAQLAVDTARDLTVRRAGEARSWLVLARTLSGSEAMDERLAALDQAIKLFPRGLEAHDLRARIFVAANRFDDAVNACNPEFWVEHLPPRLRARRAWVESQRGDFKKAIDLMSPVLEEEPTYYWALTCMADWHRALGNNAEYLTTAQALIRLYPTDTASQGYLGEAQLRGGDRAAAKATLQKAVDQSPTYEFGADLLFDAALSDGELDLAESALNLLKRHNAGPTTTMRAGKLAARRDDSENAAGALSVLCADESTSVKLIDSLVKAMEDAYMSEPAEQVLRDALACEHARALLAGRLIQMLARQKRWKNACDTAVRLLPFDQIGVEAASELLNLLGDKARSAELRTFLSAVGGSIRPNTRLWGAAGYALQAVRDFRGTIAWMADWNQRPEAEAWMLVNIAEAYRALGKDKMARPIHQHALSLKDAGQSRGRHALWIAADAAIKGDVVNAMQLLAIPETATDRPMYKFLRRMVEAAIAAATLKQFKEIKTLMQWAETEYKTYAKEPAFRRLRRRCLRRFMFHGPGVLLRIWAARQLMR